MDGAGADYLKKFKMGRYYGSVGYAETVETAPGVWEEQTVERVYYGDFTRNFSKVQPADKLNDDISVSNEISIVSDPYAMTHFQSIRYATYMGVKWKISSVEVQYPRLILTMGGIYNE